jgi:ATP-binding cassette subfamily C protein
MKSPESVPHHGGRGLTGVKAFVRDFARYAGGKGLFAMLFLALGAVVEGLGLVLIIPLLGIVIGSGSVPGMLQRAATSLFAFLELETQIGQLALLLGFFAVLMIVRAIIVSIRDVTLAELRVGFLEAMRARITDRLTSARWEQVQRLRHARITHVMSGDIQRIGAGARFLIQCVVAVTVLLVQAGLAVLLAPALALLAIALFAVSMLVLAPALRRARDLGSFVTSANLSLLNVTTQFLGGLKLAISQNLQASFAAEFRETLSVLARRQVATARQQTNTQLALTTLTAIVGAGLVMAGFGLFHIAAPVLITLLVIIGRMGGPAGQIQQGAQQLAFALPAYDEVTALERELTAIAPEGSRRKAGSCAPDGPVIFENVSFQYMVEHKDAESPQGVQAVNLTIAPGEVLGISGPSGAGKTTLADLLVGLFPPQEGRIRIGNAVLEGAVLASWRDHLAYVSQDPFLFHDTVRRNLAWAKPDACESEMWDALALSQADVVVRRMVHGLDTVVGERGTLISGGERQRIALARAILRRPHLLVLDEATSAIDVSTERRILDRLRAIVPQPTIVMIAHRAESLDHCNRVLHMHEGRLTRLPQGCLPAT